MFEDTPLVHVTDQRKLAEVVTKLSRARVIGIDTESDSFYSYREKVCLIQLSDSEADYIIDPLAVDDLSALGPILADPDVVKILHGADYDIVCLKRDYEFEFDNIFDTLIASQLLGFERIGLADLIKRFFGWEIDKQYQRHDWSSRPLNDAHIEYARGDTHWLLALRELLQLRLHAAGRTRHMREECALVQQREWQGREWDAEGFLGMKNIRGLDQRALRVLRHLWAYRDREARKLDRPVFKVIPDPVLLQLAKERPKDRHALDQLLTGKAALKRRHANGLLDAVLAGLDDEHEVKPPKKTRPKRTGPKARLRGKQAERALAELKAWRNEVVETDPDASPFTVASNGVLQRIAAARPLDLDELAAIPDVRRWQVEDYGAEILRVLDRIDPRQTDGVV